MKITEIFKTWRFDESLFAYVFILFGLLLSGKKFIEIIISVPYLKDIGILSVAFLLLLVSLYFAMNDYFDYKLDTFQKSKRNPLVTKKMTKKRMLFLMIITGIIGVALTYFISIPIFVLTIFIVISIYLYSGIPFRFKEKFGVDLITHSIPGFILIMVGFLLIAPFEYKLLIYSLTGFFLFVSGCVVQQIRDYKTDKAFGLKTTVITIGLSKSLTLLKVLTLIIYGLSVYSLLGISMKLFPFLLTGIPFALFILSLRLKDMSTFYNKYFKLLQFTGILGTILLIIYIVLGTI